MHLLLSSLLCIAVAILSCPPALAQASAASLGWQVTVPAKGGLTFEMKINGKGPYETVFDTGAVNLMSASFAQQLGLPIQDKAVDFSAIGGSIKARTVHVDTLTIGKLNIGNQTFYVLDIPNEEGTPQMVVGWELMPTFAVRMDAQRNEITFFEGTHFRYEGKGKAVPIFLHTNGNGIDVDARLARSQGVSSLILATSLGRFSVLLL